MAPDTDGPRPGPVPFGWCVVLVAQEADGAAVLVGACEAGAAGGVVGAGAWVDAGALVEAGAADFAADELDDDELDDEELDDMVDAAFGALPQQSGDVSVKVKVLVTGACVYGSLASPVVAWL